MYLNYEKFQKYSKCMFILESSESVTKKKKKSTLTVKALGVILTNTPLHQKVLEVITMYL